MNNQRGSISLGVIAFLALIYFSLFFVGCNGYGYMGYNGYHRGPSFFYWGGPRIYHEPYVRGGSIGNRSRRGGGFGSGK